jgi:uncharacterized lipoprotein NlpE involved in copper resistance
MKIYSGMILAVLLATGILLSCKKNNSSALKDYTASIKDKTWSGELTYTGKTKEYYSVHFNTDNTLLWSQLSGDYAGKWLVNENIITMTFDANTAQVKAEITDDKKLINFADNTSFYEINTGALIVNPNIPLENTIWKGARRNMLNGTTETYQMSFMPGLKVEIKMGNSVIWSGSYSRIASGAAIKNSKGIFGVVTAGNEMKGSDTSPVFPWQATKQ